MTRSRNPEAPAYVYLVAWRKAGPVKIGYTTTVLPRLAGLQTACPYDLKVWAAIRSHRAVDIEAAFHRAMKPSALRGEWFDLSVYRAAGLLRDIATDHDAQWKYWRSPAIETLHQVKPAAMPERKLYLAGASRQQVMKKHRAEATKKPVKPRVDKKREQAALDEWEYLNRG